MSEGVAMRLSVITKILKSYFFKFAIRILIFVLVVYLYLTDRDLLLSLMQRSFWKVISLLHVIWAIFMVMMIGHLIPREKFTMALRKADKKIFVEQEHSEIELLKFVQQQNLRAWYVMLVWLCFNSIFGILYLLDVIANVDLLMLTVFYFLSDYICILIFCPFQSGIMKNRCCVNCRIYDWGHFMMFTPMLFIKNFFSWSLFFTSCVVLLKWEITYAKHPERFWSGSNCNLQCSNCQDRICVVKNKLKRRK